MRLQRVVTFAIIVCVTTAVHGQTADFSGRWTGSITGRVMGRDTCTGLVSQTVDVFLTLQQSGNNVSGNLNLAFADPCKPGSPKNNFLSVALSGTASGTKLTATATQDTGNFPLVAVVTGSSLTLTIPSDDPTQPFNGTLAKAAAPSTDVTGSWGGTFNVNDSCESGNPPIVRPAPWISPATLVVVQQQGVVSGAIILYAVPDHGDQCQVVGTFPLVLPISGQVSGNTLSGGVTVPGDGGAEVQSFTATISGNSMSINGGGGKLSSTLTRGSSQVPDMQLSGAYSGSYSDVFEPCEGTPGKLPPISISGSISGPVTQIGPAIYGLLTVTGQKNDRFINGQCIVTDSPPEAVTMSGQISGNTITGVFFLDRSNEHDDSLAPFSASISGNTITFVISGDTPGDSFTFAITRSGSTPAPPQILSFTATPPSIRAGQPVTLAWSTNAASSVTLDNGIGSKPASGSVTVAPATTTTYTLTAIQGTQTATASVRVEVLSGPIVNVTTIPATMLQAVGGGSASTSYALTNSGSAPASLTLGQSNNFFTQSPASFTLAPGATQIVTVVATAQPQGTYEGTSNPSGSGVPSGLQIPVKLVSAPAPTGRVTADPGTNRVDVAASPGSSPTGSITFKNNGTARLIGVLNSDVAWLLPQPGTVTIDPGQTVTLTFSIDRSKRPDGAAPVGSTEGNLTLSFLSGASSGAKRTLDGPAPSTSITLVKVVDTVQPAVTTAGIPNIATGEVALFVSGVGHTIGTRGALFISDVSLLNPQGSKSIDDVKLYYTSTTASASSSRTTSLPAVAGQVSVTVADVVKTVFSGSDERGTLQIRSKDADKLAVAATVLTTNNPAGTFGNTIPVFRSDRSIDAGSSLVLSGVRKDSTTHTNLYVQETGGSAASVKIDFQAADGTPVSSRTDSIDPFKLLALDNVVPANAVAVVVTNQSTGGGRIAAYATPVDEASGDTWAVADWARQLGYSGADPVTIPVAGSVHGLNNTFYRTDLALTNRGTDPAMGTLRYASRTGQTVEQQVTFGGKETKVMNDLVSSFNLDGDSLGYLKFVPTAGAFAASSRTFMAIAGKPDSFGSSVPVLSTATAIRRGGTRAIAGLADASKATVAASKPATFRTNFALVETAGAPVTVKVTLRFTFPAGQKAQGVGAASRDYALNPNQFLLLNSVAAEILGPDRSQFGDLTNMEIDFQVIDGNGAVMLFTSSVDNATGDSIVRTD